MGKCTRIENEYGRIDLKDIAECKGIWLASIINVIKFKVMGCEPTRGELNWSYSKTSL